MTLWSEFLRRLMVTATLSAPATAATAEPPTEPHEPVAAEIGTRHPVPSATAQDKA